MREEWSSGGTASGGSASLLSRLDDRCRRNRLTHPPLSGPLAPRYVAMHHPFTAPLPEDLASGDLRNARAHAYDLVYNGVEVGGGSLRIYRWALAVEDVQGKG